MTRNNFTYRIYYEDTDAGGVVYYANYLKFFERARSEWAVQLNAGIEWQRAHHIFFVVHSMQIKFEIPAQLFQSLEVVSRVAKLRRASLIYDQYLRFSDRPDTILCKAEFKIACVDQQRRPCAIPSSPWHQLIMET